MATCAAAGCRRRYGMLAFASAFLPPSTNDRVIVTPKSATRRHFLCAACLPHVHIWLHSACKSFLAGLLPPRGRFVVCSGRQSLPGPGVTAVGVRPCCLQVCVGISAAPGCRCCGWLLHAMGVALRLQYIRGCCMCSCLDSSGCLVLICLMGALTVGSVLIP